MAMPERRPGKGGPRPAAGLNSVGAESSRTSRPSLKPVIQLEPTGCGIASAAAIAGIPYSRAKAVANSLGVCADDPALWSATAHVRKLLRHLGARAGAAEIPFRSWESLPDLALLSIKWHRENGQPFWHWVVFVREKDRPYVLDPKKSLRRHARTDFGRIKPKWYIAVDAPRRSGAANGAGLP